MKQSNFQNKNIKSVFIFSNFSLIIYWGNFISRTLLPICSPFIFKIFPSLWGLYISRTLRLSRTLVRFEKERLFLQRTKVSYSTTLKCIFIHIPHIHTFPTNFQFCKYFPPLPKFSLHPYGKQVFTNKHSFTIFYL